MALLTVSDLNVSYGPVIALRSVDVSLNAGEVICVLGPNGAGKTTLLRAISGVQSIRSGAIELDGKRLNGKKPWDIARLGIAHVPQGRRCFAGLSVDENLSVGGYRLPKREAARNVDRVYELFPILKEKRRQASAELSGGQQQMLAIGRALAAGPCVLLLDEPSLGLAPVLVQELGVRLRELAEAFQTAVLLAEQSVTLALKVASRGYVFQTGRCVLEGPRDTVAQGVKEAYLGKSVAAEGVLPK